jgi:hypothetical protein
MPVPAASSTLYTSVALVKASLGKETADDRDDLILLAISAASRMIDRKTGRRFYLDDEVSARVFRTSGRTYYDRSGNSHLLIDDVAETDGLIVEVGAAPTWTALTTYETGPSNATSMGAPVTSLMSTTGWWSGTVRVTARWGWPAVPDEVRQAATLLAARLYRRKDSPQGVITSADWGSVRVSRVDPDVEALLSDFALPGFA